MRRRQIDWEGGEWDIKCSVIGVFILLGIILEHMWETKDTKRGRNFVEFGILLKDYIQWS